MWPRVAALFNSLWKFEGVEAGRSSAGEGAGRCMPLVSGVGVGGVVVSMAIWGTIVLRRVDG